MVQSRRRVLGELGTGVLSWVGLSKAAWKEALNKVSPAVSAAAPVFAPNATGSGSNAPPVAEDVYGGDVLTYPGPWAFAIPQSTIILVRDEELIALAANPDEVLNLAITPTPRYESLRQICERAQARGERTLTVAFDQFFAQYRPGQNTPRRLMPDTEEYIQKIAAVGRFAGKYGLALELSLLSPLELGKDYAARTGECGIWMHYRKGVRDPKTGAFSVELWRQQRWVNNKGPIDVENAGVRVFAFRETRVPQAPYRAVNPADILEIKEGVIVDSMDNLISRADGYQAVRVRIHGRVGISRAGLDRVLAVQLYRTPEMDYFSPKALPFMTNLIDRYAAAGIRLNGLYSDEMHIQQDWSYFHHHDHGEFALRYVSPWLARKFAALYGSKYGDFAKYLIYFVHGQADWANDLSAKEGIMHSFGAAPDAVQETALFRARYYHLLQDGVVDLFAQAKRYAEHRMGHRLEARAHATWAESPTIDYWGIGGCDPWRAQYEYTSNFLWSNTVQQAVSACYDYFKWGDFLTGNGNDHAEGGWLDRNYFALAMAVSTGILNNVPYSYAAHWGMPAAVSERRTALEETYGVVSIPELYGAVQGAVHRDVDVLMLYPLDLVAVEERFGSWMTQYGYSDYVTAAKLLERGKVNGKTIEMAGRRFTTLVALFEPFPSARLLALMKEFVGNGGRLIWSSPPPFLTLEGESALDDWQEIFGVDYLLGAAEVPWSRVPVNGIAAPGNLIRFEGALAKVKPQVILTDLLVDHIYPVQPRSGTTVLVRVKDRIVGTQRGSATFIGYRPRDDQSNSLGYDTRNWYEILDALGAYPPTGKFRDANDNAEHISRTGPYLACRFPNGAVALAPHLRETEEGWSGGYARNLEEDRAYLSRHPLPSPSIRLREFRVNGYSVSYDGEHAVTFRIDEQGNLIAFAGRKCHAITIDGRRFVFAERDCDMIGWAPVAPDRRVDGGAVIQIQASGNGRVRIPGVRLPAELNLYAEGAKPGSRGELIPCHRDGDAWVFTATPELKGRWLYGVNA
jgi:hypothetical protein